MRITSLKRIVVAGALLSALTPALADQPGGVSVTAGNYFNMSQPFLGIGYQMPISPRWSIQPNAEYIFVDQGHMYAYNVDGKYLMDPSAPNRMYLGGGFGVIRRNTPFADSTDSAVNVTWGVDFDSYKGPLTPFISTRAVFSNNSDFAVSFGVRFGPGAIGTRGSRTAQNSRKSTAVTSAGS